MDFIEDALKIGGGAGGTMAVYFFFIRNSLEALKGQIADLKESLGEKLSDHELRIRLIERLGTRQWTESSPGLGS